MVLSGYSLSSLQDITMYLQSPDANENLMEQWNILSAIQREIDLRYAVCEERHLSTFMDIASPKGQTLTEAMRYIRDEVYELAPYFIDMTQDYYTPRFGNFPQYFSKKRMQEDERYSIEQDFVDGLSPTNSKNHERGNTQRFKDYLANVCHWLKLFRYRNACPYTFALSTVDRTWEYKEDTTGLSTTAETDEDWDVWNWGEGGPGKRNNWITSSEISADDNGQTWNGVQVEIFQWFRTKYVNYPPFTPNNQFVGYPAALAEGMDHYPWAKEPPWYRYEGVNDLIAPFVEQQEADPDHIYVPPDLSDWACYARLSTVNDWTFLEYGWDPAISARWQSKLSAGWDTVMNDWQKSWWGVNPLSCFPVTGLTGKIYKVPVLSGHAKQGGFFPEKGHKMTYDLDMARDTSIHEEWIDKHDHEQGYRTVNEKHVHMRLERKDIPLTSTVENPTSLSAEVCFVLYPDSSPEIDHWKRTILNTRKSHPSYPTEGLLYETVTEQLVSADGYHFVDDPFNTEPHYIFPYYTYYTDERYHNQIDIENQFQWEEFKDWRKSNYGLGEIMTESSYISDHVHFDSGWTRTDEYLRYPDSFGLIKDADLLAKDDPDLSANLSAFDDLSNYTHDDGNVLPAQQFYKLKDTLSAYSYRNLYEVLSSDIPPIGYDMLQAFEEYQPDGPYYPGVGPNTCELDQTSEMRLYTFFDFGRAFNLDLHGDPGVGSSIGS